MWSDDELQQHVTEAPGWDPSIGSDRIGVVVRSGVATLTVELPATATHSDEQIAAAASHALAWHAGAPHNRIRVAVEDCCVTLAGQVEWKFQSRAAKAATRDDAGALSVVVNRRTVTLYGRLGSWRDRHKAGSRRGRRRAYAT